MKRELIFRAWAPEMSLMIDHESLVNNAWNPLLMQKSWHFMQSTGLKDKNGTTIFEGDVVKDEKGNSHTIIFRNGLGFGSGQGTNEQIGWYYGEYGLSRFSALEVIGNIHELNQTK